MFARTTHRRLALLALALALLAALPCAALAGGDSCCGAAAPCREASEPACAQLASTPCCDAGAPLELSAPVVKLESPAHCAALARIELPEAPLPIAAPIAPALRSSDVALRSVVLRL